MHYKALFSKSSPAAPEIAKSAPPAQLVQNDVEPTTLTHRGMTSSRFKTWEDAHQRAIAIMLERNAAIDKAAIDNKAPSRDSGHRRVLPFTLIGAATASLIAMILL